MGARHEPPEEQIHIWATNLSSVSNSVSEDHMIIVREIMGLTGHRPELREKVAAHNRVTTPYVEELFSRTPRLPGMSAVDAAAAANALWIGFMYNRAFDARLNERVTRRLFRRALLALANFQAANPAVGTGPTTREALPDASQG